MSQDTKTPDERLEARRQKKEAERRAAVVGRLRGEADRTAALLKDVTAEMVEVIERLSNTAPTSWLSLGSRASAATDPFHFWLRRRAILGGIMDRLVRKASGLAENGSLDDLRHIELVLRLRDAELAMETAASRAKQLADAEPKELAWATKNAAYEWPKPAAEG